MKLFISLVVVITGLTSCSNSSNGSGDTATAPAQPVTTDTVNQNNIASCPFNLVGTYQLQSINNNGRINPQTMLIVWTQPNGTLVVTDRVNGISMNHLSRVVDGVQRAASNNSRNYQVSNCQNQTIVTVGRNLASSFTETIFGVNGGLQMSYRRNDGYTQVSIYRKVSQ